MKRLLAVLLTVALMAVSVAGVAAQDGPSQEPVDPIEGCEYFDQTGHNLCGVFLKFWNANGGLPVFGYPITEAVPEVSLDTGETYTVQYFERERMEHHTALAGTEYEILLGRLGNEVLLKQGRDWQDFEKSDPSEANYFAETGFAVPQVFLDYWMSYGLDLGDPGISFRESLALFGYPISQAEMETNADGDTVLTQWFERARFEHHPDNDAEFEVLLGRLGVEVLDEGEEPPPPAPEVMLTVITDEVLQPRHISVGPDGALYVANAGLGGEECVELEPPAMEEENGAELEQEGEEPLAICFGYSSSITRIADGVAETVVDGLPSMLAGMDNAGIHDVVVTEEGVIYGVIGFGFGLTPENRAAFGEVASLLGHLVMIEDGEVTSVADLLQYEADVNPDGGAVDSNPYSITMDGDTFLVVDAGGNTLLRVTMDGEISTVATFPTLVGQNPFAPPGATIEVESVPTDVVIGPDGAYYVGELTGGPFPIDEARVWRVTDGAEPEVFATGFTNIGAVDFDSDGNLYVMEMVSGGLAFADPEDPATAAGAVIKVHSDGSHETIASGANGLIFPTGMALDSDDTVYLSNIGIIPGLSQIVRVDPFVPEQ